MNMGFHRVIWLALVLVFTVRLHAGPHTFTDLSGRTISAEILSATDDSVRVRLKNDSVVSIKLSTLCEDDRWHVREWRKAHPAEEAQIAEHAAVQLAPGAPARTWTSADGSKSFEGELRAYDAASGEVSVILPNGKGMTFMQDKLSSDDIEWLKKNGSAPPPSQANPERDSLREVSILSFNILSASGSGPGSVRNMSWGTGKTPTWEDRREKVYDGVRKFKPDFIGAQEMQPTQLDDFKRALRQYKHIDAGSDIIIQNIEIFYLDDRWRERDNGSFSTDGGSRNYRARWAYFYDKQSRNTIYFYTTHFTAGQPPQARVSYSKVFAEHIANQRSHPEAPVIITGDFNSTVKSDAMRYLVGDFGTTPQKLVYAHAGGIDHILLSENHFTVLAKDKVPGRLSGSDHPAVFAKMRVDAWESTGE